MTGYRSSFLRIFCFLVGPLLLSGQTDTLYIPEVEVLASSIREEAIGGQTEHWSTKNDISLPSNAGELLGQNGIFIKSYGSNSLATSSIRGGSAGHTLVLWNGLPIQSPMLGLLDLSLLPVNSVEEITLQKGGNSALWGSGAIGGVLGLTNRPDFSKRLLLASQSSVGSFGDIRQQLKIGIGNNRFQSVTKAFHHQAENDFYYPIAPNFPERQQSNARFSQQNILQDLYLLAEGGHRFSAHFWQQFSERQIPPTNVQVQSDAHQNDRSTRLLFAWQQARKQHVIKAKMGYFNEHLDYYDDLALLESLSNFKTLTGELSGQQVWNNQHRLHLGVTQSHTRANIAAYKESPTENKSALFVSYQWRLDKLQLQISAREEFVDGNFIPPTPVLSLDYRPFPFLTLKGKISRNYRLPTLNDRYWIPGGNEDLKPESGWSEEGTFLFHNKKAAGSFEYSLTGFNRKIDNWILWSKREGQPFWSANNITEVWSRGLEQRLSYSYKIKTITFSLQIGYNFIRSTNQVALSAPKMKEGEQLLYTPKHNAFAKSSLAWKKLQIIYKHFYTSASRGVNESISAYQSADLRVQYGLERQKWKSTVFFDINNIWDANYFVVERRPMPGIHFQIGFHFIFSKKQNYYLSK